MSNRTGTQATSFCTSQCVCESCELKKIIQQETKIQESIVRSKKMQADSSTIKKTADTLDILTNHAGNLAFSITVFVKHLTHAVYHILNGIPWINLIFMIIGGLFRIASVFLIKDTPLWQKIAVATLGIATISLGIAGLIAFSMFMGLALMAASAAVDLVTSLMSFGKTVVDYVKLKRKFGNTELTESEKDELKPHKLKMILRSEEVAICAISLVGCVFLLIPGLQAIGAGILIAVAAVTIIKYVFDTTDISPDKKVFKKALKIDNEKEEPEIKSPNVNVNMFTCENDTKRNPVASAKPQPKISPWKGVSVDDLFSDAVSSFFFKSGSAVKPQASKSKSRTIKPSIF